VEELIRTLEAAGVLDEAEEKGHAYIAQARKAFSAPLEAGFAMNEECRALLAGLTRLIS
jgi:hypothetical protein